MSHPSGITANAFLSTAHERLCKHLIRAGLDAEKIIALTPDASTREYFRIPWKNHSTAVAAVYPEPFDPEIHPFLDVTRLFVAARLPVPEILDIDASNGIIVQEDLGDRQLRRVFETTNEEEREVYLERAISLIADIQAATPIAFERDSIASRLAFDEAKLFWELEYFLEHYFKSYCGEILKHAEEAELRAELNDLASELSARPRVLCHRDYHTSNLLVDAKNRLRVIDHQDARMGPVSYDLVSLLLDRQTCVPSLAEIRERRLYFLEERRQRGLDALDPDDFGREFRLMTVQRCLKAVGTFSYQSGVCGRGEVYAHFINPVLKIVLQALEWLVRFPVLRETIRARVGDN
jgi:aminoglycoside/choline kinase family phosphotransferase